MAQEKSKTTSKSRSKKSKSPKQSQKTEEKRTRAPADEELDRVRAEARQLEDQLEEELLRDAIMSARVALEELQTDTHGPPHERRRGIRLRDKAVKVEQAFNRLRALRRGEAIPPRTVDE